MRNKWFVVRGLWFVTALLFVVPVVRAEVVDRVVAVVNGDVITLSDLDQVMASRLPQMLQANNRNAAFQSVRRQALEHLIDERLLAQAMKRSKVEIDPDEMDRAMDGFLAQRKMTKPQLEMALRQQGIPTEVFTKRIEEEVRQMKFVQQEVGKRVKISEQEMEEFYQRNMPQFKGSGRTRVAEIILTFKSGMDAKAREAVHQRAIALARTARHGDFAALAKEYSEGPNADQGGERGIVDPATLHPQAARAMARMRVGEVSEPIASQMGYHIIKVLDRGSATGDDYVRLKDQIQQAIYQQKMQTAVEQYVRQLRLRAYIEIKD